MNLHYEESDFTIDRNDDMVIKVDATNRVRMDNSYDFNRPFLPELVYQVAQLKGNDYFDTELIVEHSDPILIAENVKIILRIIIGILMVLPTAVWADIVKELSLHYDTEDFTITRNGDMVKVDVTPMLSLDNVYDSNRPYLPEMVYNLAQLGGREFYETELTVTTSEPILLAENVTVATMNPFEANPDKEWEQYFFNDKTPQEKVKLTVFSNLWGAWVRPILYDLATGNLYLTTDIDIKVTFRRKIDSKEIHNEIRNSSNTKSENSVAPDWHKKREAFQSSDKKRIDTPANGSIAR